MQDTRQLVLDAAKQLWPGDRDSQAWFASIVEQESGFNPQAVPPGNPANVAGLFQFGPELRRAYGLTPDSPVEAQIDAGGRYLKDLWTKHRGDWNRVAAEHYMGLPRYNQSQLGGTDPEIKSFYTAHLPAIQARLANYGGQYERSSNVADPNAIPAIAAIPQPTSDPLMAIMSQFAQLAPEQRAALMQIINGGMGGMGMPAAMPQAQPTMDPRILMGLATQGGGDQRAATVVNPTTMMRSMYPVSGMPGGPQGGYLQWLGGSMQNPEPNARRLALLGLLNNLYAGIRDSQGQRQAGLPDGSQ